MPENQITVDNRTISLSSLDKVLFPGEGITKKDLIDYYLRIAEVMLPHMAGRPVSMQRFPDGIAEKEHLPPAEPKGRPLARYAGTGQVAEPAGVTGSHGPLEGEWLVHGQEARLRAPLQSERPPTRGIGAPGGGCGLDRFGVHSVLMG